MSAERSRPVITSMRRLGALCVAAFAIAAAALPATAGAKPASTYVWFDYEVRTTERIAEDYGFDELCFNGKVQQEILVDTTSSRFTGAMSFSVNRAGTRVETEELGEARANVKVEAMVRVPEWNVIYPECASSRPGEACGIDASVFSFVPDAGDDVIAPLIKPGLWGALFATSYTPVTKFAPPACNAEPPLSSAAMGSDGTSTIFTIPQAQLLRFFRLPAAGKAACGKTSKAAIRSGCRADFSRKYSYIDQSSTTRTRESIVWLDVKLAGYCLRNGACFEAGRRGFKPTGEDEPPLIAVPLR